MSVNKIKTKISYWLSIKNFLIMTPAIPYNDKLQTLVVAVIFKKFQ